MSQAVRRHAIAWVALTLVLALHVLDEATHDFLGFYNPFVMMLRDVLLVQWLPTFEFGEWLAGLIAAVVLLLIASRAAFGGSRWIQWVSIPYALLMVLNGCAHIAGSLYWQRMVPGVLSAPLLVIAGVWLLVRAAAALRS
ncbi:HXXEE domain-containing protein [uncultured Paludibaculum sp.]|uniref:HXXEE domain-containing protein n=1 Tax=uncultured Paludibaculum sp. TaxID=1765020 RepID=UPI002AABBEC0|nr:HXXEE domain-containing protein [uncultured Paludibaculum sp.]